MQKLNKQQTVEKLLQNFDFDKVHRVMKSTNWKWWDASTEDGVPSVGHLVLQAKYLLDETYNKVAAGENNYSLSTGGFEATARKYEYGEIVLNLKFVVTSFNYSTQDTCY
jgi:hypothetical protein